MFSDSPTVEKVVANIERDELVGLVMELCDFNGLTGREQNIGSFVIKS